MLSDEPPYFASRGDAAGEDVVFYRDGHYTDFPAWAVIQRDVAREACRRFLSGEPMPSNVTWVEV
jgi:hypothetical protein